MRGDRLNPAQTCTCLRFDTQRPRCAVDSKSEMVSIEPAAAAHVCAGAGTTLLKEQKLLSDAEAGSLSIGSQSSAMLLGTIGRQQPLLHAVEQQQLLQFPIAMTPRAPSHGRFAGSPASSPSPSQACASFNQSKAAAAAAAAGHSEDDSYDTGHFSMPDTCSAAHLQVNVDRDASSQHRVWKIMYSSALLLGSITALLLFLPLLLPAPLPPPPLELLFLPLFILLLLMFLALSPPLSPAIASAPSFYPAEPAR